MKSSNTYVYFGIYGEFDPDALAAEIGIEPTKSAAKHSRDPEKKLPRSSILRFAQTHADIGEGVVDVDELGDAVYEKLKDHTKRFADAIKAHDVAAIFQVVLDFPVSDDISTPEIGFSRDVVRFIFETGASIDIDTYRV